MQNRIGEFMQYAYYPGCSLKGMGKAYEESFLKVCEKLGVDIKEIEDFNCCGSTPYLALSEMKTMALTARNIALAQKENATDIVIPCNACYLIFNKTLHAMKENNEVYENLKKNLNNAGLKIHTDIKIRHPLDVFINDIGVDRISKHIVKKLENLKIACYYGCQMVRPYSEFDDPKNPTTMDNLMQITGAKVINWRMKTRCCGASIAGNMPEVCFESIYTILKDAYKNGANLIVTPCPLCQFNLEAYQDKISSIYGDLKIPVLFFTQVLGLAMGFSKEEMGIQRSLVMTDIF